MAESAGRKLALMVVPRLYLWLSRLLFLTCRVRVEGEEYVAEALADGPAIATFWHYSILYCFHQLRHYPAAVMVSASGDGEFIARLARLMGHVPVRGSSNRRGVAGLKHLLREVRSGRNAGIVADGSQGPRRRVQAGAILVSSMSGRPIVPMAWAASRYKAFGSWDRTVLPLPFCRIWFRFGEPLRVPRGVRGEELEQYRRQLEQRLNRLYDQVWEQAGQTAHDPGPDRMDRMEHTGKQQ